jgi:solute carrier family 13 (sodium-dependent dicarboxylate transporter), member 2/3/5
MKRTAATGLIAGLLALLTVLVFPAPAGLAPDAWRVMGLAVLMAIWWSTEPIPIGATSLLPLILLPLLGIVDFGRASSAYSNPLIFLFMGGFLIAAAIRRWGLHLRMAHATVSRVGVRPRRLVLGFMCASAFLSLWVSNTSTVLLLLPVAVSVVSAIESGRGADRQTRNFGIALMLGLAYGASIGGVGTLIGSPPNALLAAWLAQHQSVEISFAAWSAITLPLVLVFVPLGWLVLTRLVFPFGDNLGPAGLGSALADRFGSPERMTDGEIKVAIIFAATACLWVLRPWLGRVPGLEGLTDPGIALIGSIALFLVPVRDESGRRRFLLEWSEARRIPWHVLLLFGGGLSLATAMEASGLAEWIGASLGSQSGLHPFLVLMLIVAAVVLLTEFASNTAAVAALLPVVASIAANSGMDPVMVASALAIAASCAFMLPAATPPNALVFASGHVSAASLMRAGVVMNVLAIPLVTLVAWWAVPRILS